MSKWYGVDYETTPALYTKKKASICCMIQKFNTLNIKFIRDWCNYILRIRRAKCKTTVTINQDGLC